MANRLNDLKLNDLSGQQPQRPVGIAGRRRAKTCGDNARFLLSVETLRHCGLDSLFAGESLREPELDESLAKVLDRLGATIVSVGNPSIRPRRSIGICFQENVGSANLLTRSE